MRYFWVKTNQDEWTVGYIPGVDIFQDDWYLVGSEFRYYHKKNKILLSGSLVYPDDILKEIGPEIFMPKDLQGDN